MLRLPANFLLLVALAPLALRAATGDFRPVASLDAHWRPAGAHLTLGEALHIAQAEATRNHISFSDYLAPVFRYSYEKDQGYIWAFIYDGKFRRPAINFSCGSMIGRSMPCSCLASS